MHEQNKQKVHAPAAKGSSPKERGNCGYLHRGIFEGGKGRDRIGMFGCSRVAHATRPVSVLCGGIGQRDAEPGNPSFNSPKRSLIHCVTDHSKQRLRMEHYIGGSQAEGMQVQSARKNASSSHHWRRSTTGDNNFLAVQRTVVCQWWAIENNCVGSAAGEQCDVWRGVFGATFGGDSVRANPLGGG